MAHFVLLAVLNAQPDAMLYFHVLVFDKLLGHVTSATIAPALLRSSRPVMFRKKDVLKNFCKIHTKTPVPESFLNNVAKLWPVTLLKKRICTGAFLWILRNFYEHLLYRTPPLAASVCWCFSSIFELFLKNCYPKNINIDSADEKKWRVVGKSAVPWNIFWKNFNIFYRKIVGVT